MSMPADVPSSTSHAPGDGAVLLPDSVATASPEKTTETDLVGSS